MNDLPNVVGGDYLVEEKKCPHLTWSPPYRPTTSLNRRDLFGSESANKAHTDVRLLQCPSAARRDGDDTPRHEQALTRR